MNYNTLGYMQKECAKIKHFRVFFLPQLIDTINYTKLSPYLPFCESAYLTWGYILTIYEPGDLQRPAKFKQMKELLLITLGNKESLPRKVLCRPFSLEQAIYMTVQHIKQNHSKKYRFCGSEDRGLAPPPKEYSVPSWFLFKS